METIVNSAEDFLIDSLSFKLKPAASYVVDRKSSTFWSIGSNAYTPVGGVKLIKFQLNGDDGNWLDPSSVVFQFELVNNEAVGSTNILRPVGQPHLFFRRCRILAGGQVVEDIQDFGRNMELLSSLQNEFVRDNNDIQGFGSRWDSSGSQNYYNFAGIDSATAGTLAMPNANLMNAQKNSLPQIAGGKSKIVNFKPLCGLLTKINIYH